MNIYLRLVLKSEEHIRSSTIKKTNDHSVELHESNHTRNGIMGRFFSSRKPKFFNAVSDKWHFACSDPPFYLIKKLHPIKRKAGFANAN